MQFTTITALLVAAVGINAAAIEKRVESIPLGIYTGSGCNEGRPVSTANVPTDGACFSIGPVISGTTDSGLIDYTVLPALPAGCTLLVYSDWECAGPNVITYDAVGRCGTFGPGRLIHSARTVGTCA